MAQILKTGSIILRTGQSIFITGQIPVPVLDLDGENLIGTPGSAISLWPEAGGNNAFQTTAISQPLIETVGGKKCVRFDGVNDFLFLTVPVVAKTAFFVVESLGANTDFTPLVSGTSGDVSEMAYFDGHGENWFRHFGGLFGTSATDRLFTNGTRVSPPSAQPKLTVRHLLCLDVSLVVNISRLVNRSVGGGTSINMRMYRLVIYNKRLTDIERSAVTQQLRTLYAI